MRKLFWIVLLTLTTTGVVQGQEPGNAEVQPVIEQMRAGLEQHNLQNMLAAFDERAMGNFAQFREQLAAYFQRNESFRVRTRVLAAEAVGENISSVVEIELEVQPAGGNGPATRKSARMRIELGRAANGWKIRELSPRAFFQ